MIGGDIGSDATASSVEAAGAVGEVVIAMIVELSLSFALAGREGYMLSPPRKSSTRDDSRGGWGLALTSLFTVVVTTALAVVGVGVAVVGVGVRGGVGERVVCVSECVDTSVSEGGFESAVVFRLGVLGETGAFATSICSDAVNTLGTLIPALAKNISTSSLHSSAFVAFTNNRLISNAISCVKTDSCALTETAIASAFFTLDACPIFAAVLSELADAGRIDLERDSGLEWEREEDGFGATGEGASALFEAESLEENWS